MANKRFVNGFKYLEDLAKQRTMPKSDVNVVMEANRPDKDETRYIMAWKRHPSYRGRTFFSQRDMSALRHEEEVRNSLRNRGEVVDELTAYSV